MRKLIAMLLILSGLLMISFPKMQAAYFENQQKKLLNEWQQSMTEVENVADLEESTEEAVVTIPESIPANNTSEETNPKPPAEIKKEVTFDKAKYIKENTEGILKIDKIDLYKPVLKGATNQNLNISLASIEHTGEPGKIGNYAIAGHRNRTFGRNFNRLGEVEVGDNIEFISGAATYTYQVFEKLIVDPTEVWVLKGNGTDSLLTLVTCDYSKKPTVRLIIRAKII